MASIAAIYCRLSREDGDSKESNSITSQKEILSLYAKNNGFEVSKIYVDDGYSGTNFDRPGFQNMLADADKHLFNIILVKDLSRFGRNYIKTGYFTEEYFPEREIRVIAINDNYDSSRTDNDFAPFKNIVNEWYTKDISKKVKTSHRLHQDQGIIPTGKLPLYGYMYDEKRNRIPDPNTAHIVKEIYELYVQGKTRLEICEILTNKQYIIPGYYFYEKYGYCSDKFSKYSDEQKHQWTGSMIGRIINSREYNGDLYLAKSYVKSFKNKKDIFNKIDDQKVHKKRFSALISDELFEASLRIKAVRKRDDKSLTFEKKFYGLFKCYECGKPLKQKAFDTKKEGHVTGFICVNPKCVTRTFVKTKEALALLDKELEVLRKILLKKERFIKYISSYIIEVKEEQTPIDKSKEIKQLKSRNVQLDKLIEKIFEENINGRLPLQTFERMVKKYNEEFQQNEKLIEEYSKVPKKENINYENLGKDFINYISSLSNSRDIVWLLKIFDGILIRKRRKIDCIVRYDYGKLSLFVEAFKDEIAKDAN